MPLTITETFSRIAQGTYLQDNKLINLPRWIKEKLERHENPNSFFGSITIVGKGKYQNATCLHVAYLYWRYLVAIDEPNSKYLKKTFDLLLKDPRIDVRATFTEECLYDREEGHFAAPESYSGVYIENGNLAHYALAEEDFATMTKIVSLAPDLMNSTCSTVSRAWLYENPPIDEIESVKFFDSDKSKWVTIDDLSASDELLKKIKNCTRLGLIARFNWTEGTFSNVFRRGNVSLLHLAVRKANLAASVFIAAQQVEILDSQDQSASKHAERIMKGDLRISTEEKKQKVSDIFEVLKYVKPLPDPLPKAFYIQRKAGFDLLYFPTTKSAIVREVLYRELIESKVVTGNRPPYKEDLSIPPINRAKVQDFKGHKVAYGHLVPDADTLYSEKANQDAYLLTNFVPQNPVLNNGLWKALENKVREMAQRHLCLHVYTGSVNKSENKHGVKSTSYLVTGESDVSIPTHLFKVIYIFDYDEWLQHKVYLIPNDEEKISGERKNKLEELFLKGKKAEDKKALLFEKYESDINEIQKLSGMNFQQYYEDNYPDWLEASESSG